MGLEMNAHMMNSHVMSCCLSLMRVHPVDYVIDGSIWRGCSLR